MNRQVRGPRELVARGGFLSSAAGRYQAKCASPKIVLYMDLDGVLQHEAVMHHPRRGIYMSPDLAPGRELFEWVPYLEKTLDEFPEVRCVLSSSWCVWPGYGRTMKRLPEGLRSRFVGGTYHSRVFGFDKLMQESFRAKPRWLQIWEDVQRRKPQHWLALDDDTEGWPDWAARHLIACDGSLGLSCEETRSQLFERLRSLRSGFESGAPS